MTKKVWVAPRQKLDQWGLRKGDIVYCNLLGLEHTGIYVGDNQIVHLVNEPHPKTGRKGYLACSSPMKFRERLDGLNALFAPHCYVAVNGKGQHLGRLQYAKRALSELEQDTGRSQYWAYDLFSNNCHHFTRLCCLGYGGIGLFGELEKDLRNELGFTGWEPLNV